MNSISYAPTAFSSLRLQGLTAGSPRSATTSRGGARLPWGNTQQLVPEMLMSPEPEHLRLEELLQQASEASSAKGVEQPKHINFHNRFDHQVYRYAGFSRWTRFWKSLYSWSVGTFYMLAFAGVWTAFSKMFSADEEKLRIFLEFLMIGAFITTPSLIGWRMSSLVINRFPQVGIRPAKGPEWELNRRTGMVSVFTYKGRRVIEKSAPFHEFDAYVSSSGRSETLSFVLAHRYSDACLSFAGVYLHDPGLQQLGALWDFLQSYMDISQPLPDIPALEKHRQSDPTTAAHDQAVGRNPRYWIDMDAQTFDRQLAALWDRVDLIDVGSRPDLMAQYVRFR